jgi:hypothetical protein
MRFLTTVAVAGTALAIAGTGAAASPDGYQPQLRQPAQPDGYQPQLREGAASGIGAAALHPDSRAVRPGVVAETEPLTEDGFGFSWSSGVIGALGAWMVAVLAVVAASAMRERRRLVLR